MRLWRRVLAWVLLVFISGAALADAPRVVKSVPADGATGVATDQGQIEIFFDRNMRMSSYSVLETADAPTPPLLPDDEPWETPVRFVLRVKELKPGTRYAIKLNSATKTGFRSAEDQTPLAPTIISFTTGPGSTTTAAAAGNPSQTSTQTEQGQITGGDQGQPLLLQFDEPATPPAPAMPIPPAAVPAQSWPAPVTGQPGTPGPGYATAPGWQAAPAAQTQPGFGGTTPQPDQILGQMEAALSQLRTLSADIASVLSMGGQTVSSQGRYLTDLSRNAFAMETSAQTAQGPMTSRMICDGQTVWQEVALGGQVQAQKASLPLMQRMNGGTSPNPLVAAQLLRQQFGFTAVTLGSGRDGSAVYVLDGDYRPAYRQQVQQQIQAAEQQNPQLAAQLRQQFERIGAIRLQVGTTDLLPRAQEMLDAQGQVVMGVYLSALTPNRPLPPGAFRYQAPAGVVPVDMDQMSGPVSDTHLRAHETHH